MGESPVTKRGIKEIGKQRSERGQAIVETWITQDRPGPEYGWRRVPEDHGMLGDEDAAALLTRGKLAGSKLVQAVDVDG